MWDKMLINMHYNQKALRDKPEYRGNTYEFIEKLMKIDEDRKQEVIERYLERCY